MSHRLRAEGLPANGAELLPKGALLLPGPLSPREGAWGQSWRWMGSCGLGFMV